GSVSKDLDNAAARQAPEDRAEKLFQEKKSQHVTCRIAFASSGSSLNASIASVVGTMSRRIFRRLASRLTSSITGSLPYAPVPTTRCWHFQGIFSSIDSGVCPKWSRNFFDGFFFRLRTSPPSITTSCS